MRKLLLSIAVSLLVTALAHAAVVTYIADDETIFPNPERGYTYEYSRKVSTDDPHLIKDHLEGELGGTSKLRKSMRLALVLYNLNYFKSQDLPDAILNAFDDDMQVLRDYGYKCVLRFAYTESERDKVDATPEWATRHIQQLSSHLHNNKDVIYALEAGFIGVWGEWYYSENYGNQTQHLNSNRRQVLQALLDATPSDMFILVRYPMIKTEFLNDNTPLTAEEAYSGSYKARIGCHNDAFLNAYGDMGTYASDNKNDDPLVRQFIADETFFVPNGGESNITSADDAKKYATYKRTTEAMAKYHWSFLGAAYPAAAISKWKSEGTFDEMNIRMGYRYQMVQGIYSDEAAPGGKANITLQIRNAGYAPLYNARPAYIVLRKDERQYYTIRLQSDPRTWLPNGEITTISEQITIPADIPTGTYNMYIYLPDNHPSLTANSKYAVRFANTDVWDETFGMNALNATLLVSTAAPADPGPLPEITEAVERPLAEQNRPACDLLGRTVNPETYHGIVIENGKKRLIP